MIYVEIAVICMLAYMLQLHFPEQDPLLDCSVQLSGLVHLKKTFLYVQLHQGDGTVSEL